MSADPSAGRVLVVLVVNRKYFVNLSQAVTAGTIGSGFLGVDYEPFVVQQAGQAARG